MRAIIYILLLIPVLSNCSTSSNATRAQVRFEEKEITLKPEEKSHLRRIAIVSLLGDFVRGYELSTIIIGKKEGERFQKRVPWKINQTVEHTAMLALKNSGYKTINFDKKDKTLLQLSIQDGVRLSTREDLAHLKQKYQLDGFLFIVPTIMRQTDAREAIAHSALTAIAFVAAAGGGTASGLITIPRNYNLQSYGISNKKPFLAISVVVMDGHDFNEKALGHIKVQEKEIKWGEGERFDIKHASLTQQKELEQAIKAMIKNHLPKKLKEIGL